MTENDRVRGASDPGSGVGARATRGVLYILLACAAVTFIYPFLWMASSTLKAPGEVGSLALVPNHVTLDNYRIMWGRAPFGRALLNSVFVAGTITMLDDNGNAGRWGLSIVALIAATLVLYFFWRTPRTDDRILGALALLLAGIAG